jgi:arginyl-tRNA---protein transferase
VDQFKPRRDQRQAVNRWNKYVLGDEYMKESARLHPKSKEDKARRNDFDLVTTVHESEYVNLKRYAATIFTLCKFPGNEAKEDC